MSIFGGILSYFPPLFWLFSDIKGVQYRTENSPAMSAIPTVLWCLLCEITSNQYGGSRSGSNFLYGVDPDPNFTYSSKKSNFFEEKHQWKGPASMRFQFQRHNDKIHGTASLKVFELKLFPGEFTMEQLFVMYLLCKEFSLITFLSWHWDKLLWLRRKNKYWLVWRSSASYWYVENTNFYLSHFSETCTQKHFCNTFSIGDV